MAIKLKTELSGRKKRANDQQGTASSKVAAGKLINYIKIQEQSKT